MPYTTTARPHVGLPPITSRITIEGNGATIARQGNAPAFRLINVASSGELTLESLSLSGGSLGDFGGGVFNSGGSIIITNSTISGNTSNYYGGGVFNSGGSIIITNSTISGNTAGLSGGGVFNSGGSVIITNSTISGNTGNFGGGGVYNYSGSVRSLTAPSRVISPMPGVEYLIGEPILRRRQPNDHQQHYLGQSRQSGWWRIQLSGLHPGRALLSFIASPLPSPSTIA